MNRWKDWAALRFLFCHLTALPAFTTESAVWVCSITCVLPSKLDNAIATGVVLNTSRPSAEHLDRQVLLVSRETKFVGDMRAHI